MYCLVKIYEGNLKNQGSESFRYTIKDYKKVHGAFCSGGTGLSLVFDSGQKVLLRNFEQRKSLDVPPNKRPILFERGINAALITGVLTKMEDDLPEQCSAYLIVE